MLDNTYCKHKYILTYNRLARGRDEMEVKYMINNVLMKRNIHKYSKMRKQWEDKDMVSQIIM